MMHTVSFENIKNKINPIEKITIQPCTCISAKMPKFMLEVRTQTYQLLFEVVFRFHCVSFYFFTLYVQTSKYRCVMSI